MCDFSASCKRPKVNIEALLVTPNGGIEVRFEKEKIKKFYFLIHYWQLQHFYEKKYLSILQAAVNVRNSFPVYQRKMVVRNQTTPASNVTAGLLAPVENIRNLQLEPRQPRQMQNDLISNLLVCVGLNYLDLIIFALYKTISSTHCTACTLGSQKL